MSIYSPADMARAIGSGLLSFPVTHFDRTLAFHEKSYRAHLSWLIEHEPAALFAAGGTGEFFSLTPVEVETVVHAAAAETAGRVPVIMGVGYGLGIARDMVASAEAAGADGIMLLPPYLVNAGQAGLAAHVEAICKATRLGVILYNRDNAILDENTIAGLCERCPNLVGFKDGVGDVELMVRVHAKMGDRLVYVGGLPTAETFALPYLEMGVTTYSSAIFNFLPDFAKKFHASVRARDHAAVYDGLNRFVLPYIALRNRGKGYAVSIVKAGVRLLGFDAGPVRPPLTDITEAETADLKRLIDSVTLHTGRHAGST